MEVRTYGQYCPIARASEILAMRWTPIIVRNLLIGCETFGEWGARWLEMGPLHCTRAASS